MGQHMAFMAALFSLQVPVERGREREHFNCHRGVRGVSFEKVARLESVCARVCLRGVVCAYVEERGGEGGGHGER